MNERVSIHVSTRDRHSELMVLLQSLRYQTFQEFDVCIVDSSQTPAWGHPTIQALITRMQMEGHGFRFAQAEVEGNCQKRNQLIKIDNFGNPYILRLDDDVFIEKDYIERLVNVMRQGYDIASGVTPYAGMPEFRRETQFVKPIINRMDFENRRIGDDCGVAYCESEIIPAHSARSCFMFRRELLDAGIRFEEGLTNVAFREEQFFCLRAAWAGFNKFAVDTGAIAWHLMTQSGGCRYPNYSQLVQADDFRFWTWCDRQYKKRGSPFK